MSDEPVVLKHARSQHDWACCFAAVKTFTTGGDGVGLYGRHQSIVYEYDGTTTGHWEIEVWRNSAGINACVLASRPDS